MAIRFLDSNYYKSPFVRGLKGSLKSLYSFIICECDGAGIWHLDLQAASMYIGFEITKQEFDSHFVETGKAIHVAKNRFFFPDFIEHQYPKGLQGNNPAHKNFIETLKKFELIDENLKIKKGAKEGLKSPTSNSNGNSQGNGNGMLEFTEQNWKTKPDKDFYEMDLDEVKAGAVKQLFKLSKNHNLTNEELKGLWYTFKIQNFTGEKFYASPNDVYSHFINWSKNQTVNGSTTNKPNSAAGGGKLGTSDARTEALRKW